MTVPQSCNAVDAAATLNCPIFHVYGFGDEAEYLLLLYTYPIYLLMTSICPSLAIPFMARDC